jgi:hypothetical protein
VSSRPPGLHSELEAILDCIIRHCNKRKRKEKKGKKEGGTLFLLGCDGNVLKLNHGAT